MDGHAHHDTRATSASGLIDGFDRVLTGDRRHALVPVATGFPLLDRVLAGGLRAGELVLLGGRPGVGKTVLSLQMARNVARTGGTAIYVCYEHDEPELLLRLLALELGEAEADPSLVEKLRLRVQDAAAGNGEGLSEITRDEGPLAAAYRALRSYGDRLWLIRASSSRTDMVEIDALVRPHAGPGTVLFVDYLQKVPVDVAVASEGERVSRVTEDLKELALSLPIPVVAIAAVRREALEGRRVRMRDLRGSSALAHECDVALLMNEKVHAVAEVHLAYDSVRARGFRETIVLSVEKNRMGPLADLEYDKDLERFRFRPEGALVLDALASDERG